MISVQTKYRNGGITHRQTDIQTHGQTDRQTDTQTDTQTDRQTARQTVLLHPSERTDELPGVDIGCRCVSKHTQLIHTRRENAQST